MATLLLALIIKDDNLRHKKILKSNLSNIAEKYKQILTIEWCLILRLKKIILWTKIS